MFLRVRPFSAQERARKEKVCPSGWLEVLRVPLRLHWQQPSPRPSPRPPALAAFHWCFPLLPHGYIWGEYPPPVCPAPPPPRDT